MRDVCAARHCERHMCGARILSHQRARRAHGANSARKCAKLDFNRIRRDVTERVRRHSYAQSTCKCGIMCMISCSPYTFAVRERAGGSLRPAGTVKHDSMMRLWSHQTLCQLARSLTITITRSQCCRKTISTRETLTHTTRNVGGNRDVEHQNVLSPFRSSSCGRTQSTHAKHQLRAQFAS